MLMEVLFDQSNISNVWNFLFGHGAEFSRLTVAEEFGFDIMPHNDFIRFFLDFGLFSCLILFVILYLVGKDSVLALMLVLIYMSAFYHNMLYSLYFAPLIFIANSSAKLRLKNAD
ncbi:hypothetical protein DQ400_03420 [Vreelandella sulfidaeris]|uniref:Uncharacterized protein n=2 Tax=Vreelandella sulfidaeris TaxID=115553 RepID=A0A365TUL8_9GAMM|nr:hypothetical protein DQ400_03420 [Halomonas sulfidaeris]